VTDNHNDALSSESSMREALARTEQILAESQELALIGSWEWDIATGHLSWTAQTFRNFGEDPRTFTPSFENYTQRLHPEDRDLMQQVVQGALSSRKPFDYYHRLIRPDGSVRTLHARGRAIYDHDGKPVRMVGTGQDVTERLALEAERAALAAAEEASRQLKELVQVLEAQTEELRKSNHDLAQSQAEAQQANRAKMEFLTVMSHELRTPLNAINGYADLMEMGIGGSLSDAQRDYLARIKKSGKFLLGLINDVLSFARIDAASVSIKHEPVQLASLLETSHVLVEPQMAARNITYRYEAVDGPCVALGDAEKIEQVILNLLTNALKFTEPGGSITLSCVSRDGRARISVADTGRGIPASKLESVFDPFVQLDRSATPGSQHGVGLGLAISRALARAMGGELTAKSEVGKGSVFTLDLELSQAPR
jgi:signal transduction histidine kinase